MKKRIFAVFVILTAILTASCSFFINDLVGIWYASETETDDSLGVEMTIKTDIKMVFMVNKKFKTTVKVETKIDGEVVEDLSGSETVEGLFTVKGNKVTFAIGPAISTSTFEIKGDTLTISTENPETGEIEETVLTRN